MLLRMLSFAAAALIATLAAAAGANRLASVRLSILFSVNTRLDQIRG